MPGLVSLLLSSVCAGLLAQAGSGGVPLPAKARVYVAKDLEAVSAFEPSSERVIDMCRKGIIAFTGKPSVAQAWQTLVQPSDRIGIKVYASPGRLSGTRAVVVSAVIQGLIEAGVPPHHIIVWDRHLSDLRRSGYGELAEKWGVLLAGSADAGFDEAAFYEAAVLGRLIWGDLQFRGEGEKVSRRSHISRLLTRDITKIINIHPLFNHNAVGVYGHLYGLAIGGVDNQLRFENSPALLAEAVPEIYAQKEFSDRVVLNITDALLCQYEGEQRSLLHYTAVTQELRFSSDPVALDALSIHDIDQFRPGRKQSEKKAVRQLLENASLLELGHSELARIELIELP